MRLKSVFGIEIAKEIAERTFLSSPCVTLKRKVGTEAMKVLRKLIFAAALTTGMTLAAHAQKQDKKPPPKPPPPVIKPGEGKKPPKNEDKKKPGMAHIAGTVKPEEG